MQSNSKAIISKFFFFILLSTFLLTNCTDKTDELKPEVAQDRQSDALTISEFPISGEAPGEEQTEPSTEERFYPEAILSNGRTSAYGVTDYVDFNDKIGLLILPEYARNTFALSPYYIQNVGNAWIHVKENNETRYREAFRSNYGHYHLGYENFEPCIMSSGNFGKPSGSNCVNFDPTLEPRSLHTHAGDHWIKIYAYDYDSDSRIFDLLEIKVTNGPIQLWFKKSGGGWWYWNSLGNGKWNLSNYCTDITEVLISSTNNATSIGFDDLKVKVPYY